MDYLFFKALGWAMFSYHFYKYGHWLGSKKGNQRSFEMMDKILKDTGHKGFL